MSRDGSTSFRSARLPAAFSRVSGRRLAAWTLAGVLAGAPAAAGTEEVESVTLRFLGADIHLLAAGDGGAPTVLLLHGARYTAGTWRELGTLERLASEGYRALALDLPGHGRSAASSEGPGTFLASLLPLLAGSPVVVVSPSMSGLWSLPLVARRPSQVAGLVAVAPAGIDEHLEAVRGKPVPALVVWGAADTISPLSQADVLVQALPRSRKLVLPGAGHACYLDRPDDFHRELLAFLHEVFPRP